MSEGSPGFFRRAIDRVTGQAARQATLAKEQIQKEAAAEADRQVRVNEKQRIISIATQRPAVALSPDFDAGNEVARIAKNIEAIDLYGKFHGGVTINGEAVVGGDTRGDAQWYGDFDKISRVGGGSPHGSTEVFRTNFINLNPLHVGEVKGSYDGSGFDPHFLTAINLADEHAVVSYQFFNAFHDRDLRLGPGGIIQFLLPKQDAFTLLDAVRKNPDSFKDFMTQGAQGFMESARVKPSETISIINLDRFDSVLLNSSTEMSNFARRSQIWRTLRDNTNGVRETYHYSRSVQKN